MKVLQIVNLQRDPLVEITWEKPDVINFSIKRENIDPKLKDDLISYLITSLEKFKNEGIPLRNGKEIIESDGSLTFIEELHLVKSDNEQFLEVLSDRINSQKFILDQDRLFALVK
ncbi:hypothetical protein [Dolichospermum sp. LEGE 00246]|uniref:hypothetical protein n=1 Tax=Dolichospermum sp. LEGE 00246 TaxID=1828605 RepID=UPI00188154A7|nr:hypothetical protein [Dolichospermum sp. LEGE 00246]MBE9258511.1 hypothetical protein [Dolichospermum sp. LEGE 00246]